MAGWKGMRRRGRGRSGVRLVVVGALLMYGGWMGGPALPAAPWQGGLWVDPDNSARRALDGVAGGGGAERAVLRWLAGQPVAVWLTQGDPLPRAREVSMAAEAVGRVPVLVAYHIPGRDCGQHSAGGAADAAGYRWWVSRLAAGLGDRRAVVILEPDAVAQALTGCAPAQLRQRLLAEAVDTLQGGPGVRVYLDAGNPGWVRDTGRLAAALAAAGGRRADGFALNVASFHTTRTTVAYGEEISRALGGAHFVIDTSRNGNGPPPAVAGAGPNGGEAWCNPPGRALGRLPTASTGHPRLDAYLWVKVPGESDGTCRGGPPAGRWWMPYAVALAHAVPGRETARSAHAGAGPADVRGGTAPGGAVGSLHHLQPAGR